MTEAASTSEHRRPATTLAWAGLPSASIPRRIDGLDELRGIAVLVVVLAHGSHLTTWFPDSARIWGVQGVYLFFAISGYLITRILLDLDRRGEPLSTFYVRRFLRIWPLMLVALFASALLYPGTRDAIAYNLILMNNYAVAAGLEPAFRTGVMWSLAIEEQFYLLWPVVVLSLPRQWLPFAIGVIVAFGFAFASGLLPDGAPDYLPGHPGAEVNLTTHANMQYLALGAAIAVGWQAIAAALAGTAAVVSTHLLFGTGEAAWAWHGMALISFAAVCATVRIAPLLRLAPLAHLGRLCFGLYLTHFFVAEYVGRAMGKGAWAPMAIYLASSYALAIVSLYLIEAPALRFRTLFETSARARLTLAGAAAAIVISALAFATMSGAGAKVAAAAKVQGRVERLMDCAGVGIALAGTDPATGKMDEGRPGAELYFAAMGQLETDGVEFAARSNGAQQAAQVWRQQPAIALEKAGAACREQLTAMSR